MRIIVFFTFLSFQLSAQVSSSYRPVVTLLQENYTTTEIKNTNGDFTPTTEKLFLVVSGIHDIDLDTMGTNQFVTIINDSGGIINLGTISSSFTLGGQSYNGSDSLSRLALAAGESVTITMPVAGGIGKAEK